ncbi:FecR family protein [Flavobacterium aquicola]|uniref:FecR family protein n=1 Tax=Flavobacterium aquicola TaxID=1682742 RepID=A0A3E0EJG8_9FLAO|nr:FecR family protein [Flavobacterium aquicola]REG98414.1 FecR family protein [Flavobacterium aquicola]
MKITPEILKKYASQQCSEQENKIVERWLKTENQTENEEDVNVPDFLEEKIWTNIKSTIAVEPEKKETIFQKKTTWAIAASIALLIGLTFFKQSSSSPEEILVCQTLAGEMKNFTLSDGTLVHLNANSFLKIPKKFTANTRIVTLAGEAYFEVAKDSLRPFTIKTKKSETTVLGTKFNLSAYADEQTTLTLDEGKVSFKSKTNTTKPIIILPNEQAVLTDESLIKSTVNTKYYKGWMSNTLYFNNESFSSIAHKIERGYGVEIQIKKLQLENQLYKGEFNNPNIETLLDDLSYVLKFKYEIKENHIIIY